MSSYLSKSTKDFKPKVTPRRAVTVLGGSQTQGPRQENTTRQSSTLQSTSAFETPQPSPQSPAWQAQRGDSRAGRISEALRGRRPSSEDHGVAARDENVSQDPKDTIHVLEVPGASTRHQQLPSPSPTQQITDTNESRLDLSQSEQGQRSAVKRHRNGAPISRHRDEQVGLRSNQKTDKEDRVSLEQSTSGDTVHHAQETRSAKKMRIDRLASTVLDDVETSDSEDAHSVPKARRKYRPRKRAPTPDDAENAKILPTLTVMSDLTKDMRQGKKSGRERRLQERDKAAQEQRKAVAQAQARSQGQNFMENPTGNVTNDDSGPSNSASTIVVEASPARLAPRVRVVNGQIVQDEESRILDRHQAATAASGPGMNAQGAAIEEDELTRLVNSGSYMQRERQTKWTTEETERFYQGLRWFGTDFQTIGQMFPGRSRRQIKLKFNKEERNPRMASAVQRALHEEKEMVDLVAFQRYAERIVPPIEDFKKAMADDEEALKAAQKRDEEGKAAMVQERVAQAENEAAAWREEQQQQQQQQQRRVDATSSAKGASAHNAAISRAAEAVIEQALDSNKGRGRGKGKGKAQGQTTVQAASTLPINTIGAVRSSTRLSNPSTTNRAARGEEPESNHEVLIGKKKRGRQSKASAAGAPPKSAGAAIAKGKEIDATNSVAVAAAEGHATTPVSEDSGLSSIKGNRGRRRASESMNKVTAAAATAASTFSNDRNSNAAPSMGKSKVQGKSKATPSAPASTAQPGVAPAVAVEMANEDNSIIIVESPTRAQRPAGLAARPAKARLAAGRKPRKAPIKRSDPVTGRAKRRAPAAGSSKAQGDNTGPGRSRRQPKDSGRRRAGSNASPAASRQRLPTEASDMELADALLRAAA